MKLTTRETPGRVASLAFRWSLVVVTAGGPGLLATGCSSCGSDGGNSSIPSQGGAGQAGSAGGHTGGGQGGTGGAGTGPSGPGSQTIPEQLTTPTGCTWPGCSNLARACDDYLRAGCGQTFDYTGPSPGTQAPSQEYLTALASCTGWARLELQEHLEEKEGEEEEEGEENEKEEKLNKELVFQSSMVARCTRQARGCSQQLFCLRGGHVPTPLPDFVTIPAPTPPPPPPAPAPTWTIPYAGEGKDPWFDLPPWKGQVAIMPGDSPSCTACAIQRCPDFAYYCMGALGNETDCPAGDCCQGLRQCILECGGYEPFVHIARFDRCVAVCSQGRPHALQQLVNLQQCGDVACNGCTDFDPQTPKASTP